MNNIKIVLHILAVIGLLITLGEMIGWFRDKDRIDFLNKIENDLKCPKDHPGAKIFINDYVVKNSKFTKTDFDLNDVEYVTFVGTFQGSSAGLNKKPRVDGIQAGTIRLKNIHGQTTVALCDYEELRSWSKEAPFWKWLGFGLLAISIILNIVLFIIEYINKSNNSNL